MTRAVLPMAALALAAVLVLLVLRPLASTEPGPSKVGGYALMPAAWAAPEGESVSLEDGSRIDVGVGAALRAKGADPARVDLALDRGRATFDVRPGGSRAWSIDAGSVIVRVVGTRFSVARDGESVDVTVERGKVLVEGARVPGGSRLLVAGDSLHVEEPPSPRTHPTLTAPPEPSVAPSPRPAPPAPRTNAAGPERTATIDPMTRADAARRGGRPRDAIARLMEIVDRRGPGASLAAFTAAKIHDEDLGDPSSAAPLFVRAADLGLPAGLDEEALARAVAAFARAGSTSEAARAAARYEAQFPRGRHAQRVRSWAYD